MRPPPSKHSQQRAAAWRSKGGRTGQQECSRAKARNLEHSKSKAIKFYNEVLAEHPEVLAMCRERTSFDDTLRAWKDQNEIQNLSASTALQHLKDAGLVFQQKSGTSSRIVWTVDVDNMVMSFYDAILRNNPRLRRSCTNRRVLNDTINQWKIDQRFQRSQVFPNMNISPAIFVSTLMKLGVITNTRDVSTRDEIIWADAIEDITPLSPEEQRELVSFDQKQMRANRAGLTFYNQMLKDNRVLRRACAYRNILDDVIHEWKQRPSNAGDPPKDGVACAGIIRGLVYKWGLINHVNNEQGIVAWKEDVKYYNDGVIQWKDAWPGLDNEGNRIWLSDEEFKKRGEEMKNEYAAIVALSFYNLVVRDNLQLRSACTHRYFLNDTIDAWKMEPVESGNPPRNVTRSNIIHQLQRQWGFIVSIEDDTVVWKQDVARNKESVSFNDMLTALMSGDAASLKKS